MILKTVHWVVALAWVMCQRFVLRPLGRLAERLAGGGSGVPPRSSAGSPTVLRGGRAAAVRGALTALLLAMFASTTWTGLRVDVAGVRLPAITWGGGPVIGAGAPESDTSAGGNVAEVWEWAAGSIGVEAGRLPVIAVEEAEAEAQTWSNSFTDTFIRGNGAPGNGWTDISGGQYSISSNTLLSGSDQVLGGNVLLQAADADRADAYFSAGANFPMAVLATADGAHVYLTYTDYNNIYLIRDTTTVATTPVSGLSGTLVISINRQPGSASGKKFTATVSASGTPDTPLFSVVLDNDATVAFQSGLKPGVSHYGVDVYTLFKAYTLSNALSAGTITSSGHTDTTASLSVSSATNGTAPYTVQWYRSTSSGFTPGVGSLLAGQTSSSLADTGLSPSTTYYYKVVATDAVAATATSVQFSLTTDAALADVRAIFIGDSITGVTNGYNTESAVDKVGEMLQKMGTTSLHTVSLSNEGRSGSKVADWVVNGNSYMFVALAHGTAISANVAIIMLGTNDAIANVSATSYGNDLATLCANLLGAGYTKIILNYSPYTTAGGADSFIVSYQAKIDALVNGTTILQGDRLAYSWFRAHSLAETVDGTHPNALGTDSLGTMWAKALYDRLLAPAPTGGGGRRTIQGASLKVSPKIIAQIKGRSRYSARGRKVVRYATR